MRAAIGKKQIACLAGGILLCLLAQWNGQRGEMGRDGSVLRNSYGEGEKVCQLEVLGLEEEPYSVTLTLEELEYQEEEAEALFQKIRKELPEQITGENPSLSEVRSNLNLITTFPGIEGVRMRWTSEEPELMNSFGEIETGEILSSGRKMILEVEMTSGEHHAKYEIPICLFPPEYSEQDMVRAGFHKELQEAEEQSRTSRQVRLPEEYNGKPLSYRQQGRTHYEILILLGGILAVLLYLKEKMQEEEKQKKRQQELLMDYAEVVFKLKVFTGAGMTVLNIWKRMVSDYEKQLQEGSGKPRAVYEEMKHILQQIQYGVSESHAYAEFGKRCRLQPYLKLSSILDQNRKTGTKNFSELLELEMAEAWEQRKNLARRLGEEAGTRLLVPLFLMLLIIMVMIMMPAMLAIG